MSINVTHIITGLSADGAETVLYRLLSGLNPREFKNEVISLTDRGAMSGQIESLGVPVRSLGMSPAIRNPYCLVRLASWIRHSRPAIVQTWMYYADLFGGLCARIVGQDRVIWNIRHSYPDVHTDKPGTIRAAQICGRLSKWVPTRIVCCSEVSRRSHIRLGYAPAIFEVIPNGFDVEQFKPDPTSRYDLRRTLGIPPDSPVIGLVARFHPVKDHANFIAAAGRLHEILPEVRFLLCGEAVVPENSQLNCLLRAARINTCCSLLGRRDDIPRVLAALDIATSASFSEAFPNSVAEAMACGIPCVVTDVGDSAAIVGETGRVVPPRNPKALAAAWRDLIDGGAETRAALGAAARERVRRHFSLSAFVKRYEKLYTKLGATNRPSEAVRVAEIEH